MIKPYPVLTRNERDRRWKNVRRMMEEKQLECLIVAGLKGREQLEGYLSNDYCQGVIVFPFDSESVYLARDTRILRNLENCQRGVEAWISDWRGGPLGPELVRAIQEKNLASSLIGVVGLESVAAGESHGVIPYKLWAYVQKELPKVKFIDVSKPFSELMLVKGEEELSVVRYGAWIGEKACEAMLNITRPGISEGEICGAIMNTILSHGASTPNMILHSGPDNTSWGEPIWFYKGQPPRRIEEGDIVQAEIFPRYGGIETQQQMSIAVKPIHPVNAECAAAARRSYEIGLEALRPGKRFMDVAEAMEGAIRDAGYWHLTPLIHSLSPLSWAGQILVGIEKMPGIERLRGLNTNPIMGGGDLVIKPGMIFELEPNACKGKHRINIGGTVLVTETGAEELNRLATKIQVA